MDYLLLIVGFLLLVKGADWFVDGSSQIAKKLRIPSIVIGLTVVAMGTSLPEASVSITAAIDGENEIALGNIIGSNIVNLLFVLGLSAVIKPVSVKGSVLKKEFPYTLAATVLLLLFIPKGLSRLEGILFLIFFVLFIIESVYTALKARQNTADEEPAPFSFKSILFTLIGLVAVIFGGNLVVDAASSIAFQWGISETLIGLTIVAIGTSLPELVTSAVAAKKGESDIALGNVLGSNIFNILFILGSSCTIAPITPNPEAIIDTALLLLGSLLCYGFSFTKKQISRTEGAICMVLYLVYTAYIILR